MVEEEEELAVGLLLVWCRRLGDAWGCLGGVAQFPPTSRLPTTRREAVDDPFQLGCRSYLAFLLPVGFLPFLSIT